MPCRVLVAAPYLLNILLSWVLSPFSSSLCSRNSFPHPCVCFLLFVHCLHHRLGMESVSLLSSSLSAALLRWLRASEPSHHYTEVLSCSQHCCLELLILGALSSTSSTDVVCCLLRRACINLLCGIAHVLCRAEERMVCFPSSCFPRLVCVGRLAQSLACGPFFKGCIVVGFTCVSPRSCGAVSAAAQTCAVDSPLRAALRPEWDFRHPGLFLVGSVLFLCFQWVPHVCRSLVAAAITTESLERIALHMFLTCFCGVPLSS